jgi:NTE family protein
MENNTIITLYINNFMVEDFIDNSKVKAIIKSIQALDKIYSDVIDEYGNQYVDIVMEGGGMLGIGLVGYIYGLEKAGIRFCSIGGNSAGSIAALLLAAIATPENEKTTELIEIMCQLDFVKFLDDANDDGEDAKEFVLSLSNSKENLLNKIKATRNFIYVIDSLWKHKGIVKGETFHNQIIKILKEKEITNTNSLLTKMNDFPTLNYPNKNTNPLVAELGIVATELKTSTKFIFPKNKDLIYGIDSNPNPADFVRASTSVPFLFKPFSIQPPLPYSKEFKKEWKEQVKFNGVLPEEFLFVDGGVMSNFPIDIFHTKNKTPRMPTFGVKLGYDREDVSKASNAFGLLSATLNAAMNVRDFEFVYNNPDFEKIIGYIDVQGFNWLDFNMDLNSKIKLFSKGVEAAHKFLSSFNWEEYKELRGKIAGLKIHK